MGKWKYKETKAPTGRGRVNGFMLEHRHFAEEALGRNLKDTEVVHHIDNDRANNSPSNLAIFASLADHARFHSSRNPVVLVDAEGVNHCVEKPKSASGHILNNKCIDCSKPTGGKRCPACYRINSRKVDRPAKKELDKLVKKLPMTRIGKMFGVSDNAVRKWIKAYELEGG
jgi:hypothetical protein